MNAVAYTAIATIAASAAGFYTDGPISTDPGSILDYDAGSGECFEKTFAHSVDFSPTALIARVARKAYEAAYGEHVDAAAARDEVKSRHLDHRISIPDDGVSRYQLDLDQYLQQREISMQVTLHRSREFPQFDNLRWETKK